MQENGKKLKILEYWKLDDMEEVHPFFARVAQALDAEITMKKTECPDPDVIFTRHGIDEISALYPRAKIVNVNYGSLSAGVSDNADLNIISAESTVCVNRAHELSKKHLLMYSSLDSSKNAKQLICRCKRG